MRGRCRPRITVTLLYHCTRVHSRVRRVREYCDTNHCAKLNFLHAYCVHRRVGSCSVPGRLHENWNRQLPSGTHCWAGPVSAAFRPRAADFGSGSSRFLSRTSLWSVNSANWCAWWIRAGKKVSILQCLGGGPKIGDRLRSPMRQGLEGWALNPCQPRSACPCPGQPAGSPLPPSAAVGNHWDWAASMGGRGRCQVPGANY